MLLCIDSGFSEAQGRRRQRGRGHLDETLRRSYVKLARGRGGAQAGWGCGIRKRTHGRSGWRTTGKIACTWKAVRCWVLWGRCCGEGGGDGWGGVGCGRRG